MADDEQVTTVMDAVETAAACPVCGDSIADETPMGQHIADAHPEVREALQEHLSAPPEQDMDLVNGRARMAAAFYTIMRDTHVPISDLVPLVEKMHAYTDFTFSIPELGDLAIRLADTVLGGKQKVQDRKELEEWVGALPDRISKSRFFEDEYQAVKAEKGDRFKLDERTAMMVSARVVQRERDDRGGSSVGDQPTKEMEAQWLKPSAGTSSSGARRTASAKSRRS